MKIDIKIEYETEGQNWIIEDKRFKNETDNDNFIVLSTKEIIILRDKLNKLIESKKFKKIQTLPNKCRRRYN